MDKKQELDEPLSNFDLNMGQEGRLNQLDLRKKSLFPSTHPSRKLKSFEMGKDASVQVDENDLSKQVGGKYWEAMQLAAASSTIAAAASGKQAIKNGNKHRIFMPMSHNHTLRSDSNYNMSDYTSGGGRGKGLLSRLNEQRKVRTNEFFRWFLMYKSIKKIEGKMGSNVAQYFIFLRWVVVLDIAIGCLWGFFVMLPQSLDPLPQKESTTGFLDLITGSGAILNTPMFYSGYRPVASTLLFNTPYRIDVSYVLITYSMVLLSLVTTVLSLREFIKRGDYFTLVMHDDLYKASIPLLTTWDYTITSKDGVKSMQSGILQTLREVQQRLVKHKKRGFVDKYLLPFTGWTLTVLLYGASSYAFYVLIIESVNTNNFYLSLLASGIISVANIIVPLLFYSVTEYEYRGCSYDTITKITTVRNYLWRIITLCATLFSIYLSDNPCWQVSFGQAMYQLLLADIVGQCFYYTVGLIITQRIYQYYYLKTLQKNSGKNNKFKYRHSNTNQNYTSSHNSAGNSLQKNKLKKVMVEFDIPYNLNGLLYTQTLIWVGSVYAPSISIIGVAGTMLVFGCRIWGWMRVGTTPNRFSSWNSYGFCLIMFTITLLLNSFVIGYLSTLETKSTCGPFIQVPSMHAAISEYVSKLPGFLAEFFHYIINVGFHGSVSTLFLGLASCLWLIATNLKKKNQTLVSTIVSQRDIINRLFHTID